MDEMEGGNNLLQKEDAANAVSNSAQTSNVLSPLHDSKVDLHLKLRVFSLKMCEDGNISQQK